MDFYLDMCIVTNESIVNIYKKIKNKKILDEGSGAGTVLGMGLSFGFIFEFRALFDSLLFGTEPFGPNY